MADIVRFEVPSLSDEQQAHLNARLSTVIYPNELEQEVGWDYGAPTWAVKSMVEKWQTYDFEAYREEINQWHHYRTPIDGLNIHFIHEPSPHPNALPILLCHGWPSTFYEFHKVINVLRDGKDGQQPFHVIVPSLPGFGFSDAPKDTGYGALRMAKTMNQLMIKLGYKKYMWAGGDWGGIIGKVVASRYGDNCMGFYTHFPMVRPPVPSPRNLLFHPFKVVKFFSSLLLGFDRVYGKDKVVLNGATFANAELSYTCGYRAIQGTKPYTLAYGLSDSPVGLLGWLLEKYHDWTHHESDEISVKSALPSSLTPEEFLTQVTLFWLTNSLSSSIRIYYEVLHRHEMFRVVLPRVHVPTAVSNFAHDLSRLPVDWLAASTNLVQFREYSEGGHFPALESHRLVAADIQAFGKKLSKSAKL
ncbi:alpha/beta-hydrolase [Hesseltinella vesiculosa]|uniref:Alpha/beta-hydrolase n=1 Tax=Hesseltinella vesiculosa TaxID=101127 RepID=A0A1X2GL49_9FUNG|nr:alpha/beta-hydrolase [Hesseltinella vesiculosa]